MASALAVLADDNGPWPAGSAADHDRKKPAWMARSASSRLVAGADILINADSEEEVKDLLWAARRRHRFYL